VNNNATLVEILQNIGVPVPENVVIPANAVTPKDWSVFTMWKTDPADAGKSYTQIVQLLWPDKTEFQNGVLSLEIEADKATHQSTVNIMGFPVGQEGPVTINTWLELNGKKVGEEYSYIISVKHQKAPAVSK